MIPDATIKNKFLKLRPPPDITSIVQSHIHNIANNVKPIILPIPTFK